MESNEPDIDPAIIGVDIAPLKTIIDEEPAKPALRQQLSSPHSSGLPMTLDRTRDTEVVLDHGPLPRVGQSVTIRHAGPGRINYSIYTPYTTHYQQGRRRSDHDGAAQAILVLDALGLYQVSVIADGRKVDEVSWRVEVL